MAKKRIETSEKKVKLTLLLPESVVERVKEISDELEYSQSLYIMELVMGDLSEPSPAPLPVTPPVTAPAPPAIRVIETPPGQRLSAMEEMQKSRDNMYGGTSTAEQMMRARMQSDAVTKELLQRQIQDAKDKED